MVGVLVAVVYTNIFEWFAHKYLLHERGKNRQSFWSFHWHEHHRACRRANMLDDQYVHRLFIWASPQLKEAASVVLGVVLHLPLYFVSPWFAAYIVLHGIRYYVVHRRAHMDTEWCRQNMPWHYDHHMGRDQNANWCVTHPWFDYVMGTRKRYAYDASGRVVSEEAVPSPRGVYGRLLRPLVAGRKERVRVVGDDLAKAA